MLRLWTVSVNVVVALSLETERRRLFVPLTVSVSVWGSADMDLVVERVVVMVPDTVTVLREGLLITVCTSDSEKEYVSVLLRGCCDGDLVSVPVMVTSVVPEGSEGEKDTVTVLES